MVTVSEPAARVPVMPTFNVQPDRADQLARCPIPLVVDGPRCLSLVLVRDAAEHEQWHEDLQELLHPDLPEHEGVLVAPWPAPAPETEPTDSAAPADGSHL